MDFVIIGTRNPSEMEAVRYTGPEMNDAVSAWSQGTCYEKDGKFYIATDDYWGNDDLRIDPGDWIVFAVDLGIFSLHENDQFERDYYVIRQASK